MVTVPVGMVHVGCIGEIMGADGVPGCVLSVIVETAEVHPAAFWAITVCEDPAVSPL